MLENFPSISIYLNMKIYINQNLQMEMLTSDMLYQLTNMNEDKKIPHVLKCNNSLQYDLICYTKLLCSDSILKEIAIEIFLKRGC